jgi:hypothetical protein
MRVSRQWRHLKALKRAGFGHNPDQTCSPGDLVLFCPTCPQPGVNISESEIQVSDALCALDYI